MNAVQGQTCINCDWHIQCKDGSCLCVGEMVSDGAEDSHRRSCSNRTDTPTDCERWKPIAPAKMDTARLDWLETQGHAYVMDGALRVRVTRENIDRAMGDRRP